MTEYRTSDDLYCELENELPTSTAKKRVAWAIQIIDQNIDIKWLSKLLYLNKPVASRFLWLLSEIGILNSSKLHNELPSLFKLSNEINHIDMKKSFPTFWNISGVPIPNEAEAIDLLFSYISSQSVDVTTKSRSLIVLLKLTKKHTELINELKPSLENEIEINTNSFTIRAKKVLEKL